MFLKSVGVSPQTQDSAYNAVNSSEQFLTLGRGSYIGEMLISIYPEANRLSHLLAGRFSSLAENLRFLTGGNHPYKNVSSFPFDVPSVVENIFGNVKPIRNTRTEHYQIILGHDVWLGHGVTILGGVKIGNGAVVGANSVVAKNIPPYAIAVGNPARVVKYRFDAETIKKVLAVKWWNWSLEKVADNLPLMTDVEKFLDVHWSPELENFPRDEIGCLVENFRAQGFKIYNFVADFRAQNPLWLRVVAGFCKSDFENGKLVVWLDKNSSDEDFNLLAEFVKSFGNGADKNILAVDSDEKISPHALRSATHFITTREMTTLECLDWLWDTDVEIVSALDENIFDGEPLVDWEIFNR